MEEFNKHIHEYLVIYHIKYEGKLYKIFKEKDDAVNFIQMKIQDDDSHIDYFELFHIYEQLELEVYEKVKSIRVK